jgi:Fe-S oxidoreductase
VLKFGGTTSGEHGEGISRGEFTKGLFGSELTNAFQEIKEAFDPEYRFNPGKIIHPPEMDDTNLLRYGTNYRADHQPKETILSFKEEQGFDRAVEMCNGAGVCRQLDGGVMCPTFQATRDETHSTRGRANTLRAAISGRFGSNGMTSSELYQVMELCLSCQACLNECPSAVDMSKLKAEFLHQYNQKHGLPFRSWFFSNIEEISKLVQPLSFLINPFLEGPTGSLVSLIGIHPERKLPAFAKESFTKWHNNQEQTNETNGSRQAVFFYDTYLEYNYPHIGKAVVRIFNKAGIELVILQNKVDSGRPAYSKGVLSKAKAKAIHNLKQLEPYAKNGTPIVGVEPSVIVMLKKEYRDLVPGKEADRVAALSSLIEEYLIRGIETEKFAFHFDGKSRKILYHGHCQQKANLGTEKTIELLKLIPNCTVEEIEAGCCGMAGAFGYEREHYSLSLEIAELALAPRIRNADPETIIAASGTSCREQILHTTQRKALHPLEIFSDALV